MRLSVSDCIPADKLNPITHTHTHIAESELAFLTFTTKFQKGCMTQMESGFESTALYCKETRLIQTGCNYKTQTAALSTPDTFHLTASKLSIHPSSSCNFPELVKKSFGFTCNSFDGLILAARHHANQNKPHSSLCYFIQARPTCVPCSVL